MKLPVTSEGDVSQEEIEKLRLAMVKLQIGRRMQIRAFGRVFQISHLGENLHVQTEGRQENPGIVVNVPGVVQKIDPEVWGPKTWQRLHSQALVLDSPEDRKHLIRNLVIPCGECKTHWKEVLKEYPPILSGISTFFAWSVNVHNAVNRKLEKKEIGVNDAYIYWSQQLER